MDSVVFVLYPMACQNQSMLGAGGDAIRSISGTEIRDCLAGGRPVPEWMMRPVVQDVVLKRRQKGQPVFQA